MCEASNDLLTRVQHALHTHAILAGSRIVVAVSGGPDSVALLDLLHRLGSDWRLDLHVAHLNHRLRPTADGDARFVEALAGRLSLPFHQGTTDVRARAKREKRSIEDAARQARREFLTATQSAVGAAHIALGHTRSDQAETVLMRLLRGAGLAGLGGIRPATDGGWIRPLLDVSRNEIEAYVAFRGLETRIDETNADVRFVRNRIRHALLPHLQTEYNPQIEATIARTADLLQTDESLLEHLAQEAFSQVVRYCAKRKIILDVKRFFGYHISLRRRLIRMALFELSTRADAAEYQPVQRVLHALGQDASNIQIIDDMSAHRIGDLCILALPMPPYCMSFCIDGYTPIPDTNARLASRMLTREAAEPLLQTAAADRVFFDLEQLPRPIQVRSPRAGDRFHPFGMRGQRKISALLIDSKIPHALRDEVPLLVGSDGTVLWVVGLRRASMAPVTSVTHRVIEVRFDGGWQHEFFHPEKRLS